MESALEIGQNVNIHRDHFPTDKAFLERLADRLMGKQSLVQEMTFIVWLLSRQ